MEQPAAPVRIEELLSHRAWVRRVARALVLDESRADDLEQEAWLRAVRSPPPRPSRAWLGTVLRNAAVNLRLAERRRTAHESSVTLSGDGLAPAELLERAEIVERVARAVRTLEEPYRTAILLRYFEDLAPPAIAARLGVPLETVRTRLRRALVRLREEMDREHRGDRKRWTLLLLPLARQPEPAAAGAALSAGVAGGLVMTLKAKAAVGAAVLLLLAGTAWRFRPSEEAPPDQSGPVAAAPPTADAAPAIATPAGEVPASAPAIAAGPRPVLVVDPDGRP
ncbi:MAG TPA: sigma-70 family RNA polymerase sigma factor, partial [Planctomycetota bacterium]|nr:sigma-70 family RNA polymerase sigma factor [Planctomycetota bacterium]